MFVGIALCGLRSNGPRRRHQMRQNSGLEPSVVFPNSFSSQLTLLKFLKYKLGRDAQSHNSVSHQNIIDLLL